jgi:hypothetical protein
MQLSSDHDRGAQINGARAVPRFPNCNTINQLGSPFFCRIILPSACPQSPRVILSFLTLRSWPATYLLSTSAPSLKGSFLLEALLHGPSSVAPLGYHSHPFPPLPRAPQCHRFFIPHVRLSSLSVVPDGSSRSLPWPKMLSWLNHLQSQEAVIKAVGGG